MPGNAAKQTVWGFVKQWELPAIHSASLVSTDWPECSVPCQLARSSRYCCPAFEKWSRCGPTKGGEMMLNIILWCYAGASWCSQRCLSIEVGKNCQQCLIFHMLCKSTCMCAYTVVSQKSAHGWSSSKIGGGCSFECFVCMLLSFASIILAVSLYCLVCYRWLWSR